MDEDSMTVTWNRAFCLFQSNANRHKSHSGGAPNCIAMVVTEVDNHGHWKRKSQPNTPGAEQNLDRQVNNSWYVESDLAS